MIKVQNKYIRVQHTVKYTGSLDNTITKTEQEPK